MCAGAGAYRPHSTGFCASINNFSLDWDYSRRDLYQSALFICHQSDARSHFLSSSYVVTIRILLVSINITQFFLSAVTLSRVHMCQSCHALTAAIVYPRSWRPPCRECNVIKCLFSPHNAAVYIGRAGCTCVFLLKLTVGAWSYYGYFYTIL